MMNYTGRMLRRILLSPSSSSTHLQSQIFLCTKCPLHSSSLSSSSVSLLSAISNNNKSSLRVSRLSSLAPQPSSSSSASAAQSTSTANQNAFVGGALTKESAGAEQLPAVRKRRRRREILKMDESEYEGYAVLVPKAPLIDRRGEAQSNWFRSFAPETKNMSDVFAVMHHDWDLRGVAVKRWWTSLQTEKEIHMQSYDPKRVSILGSDLGAAHFIVFRKGKVRFRGRDEWVDSYRKDLKPGTNEDDLPVMRFEYCSLPTKYDPNYRLEAIDCSGVGIRYEGLLNFQNLDFIKWLSFRDCPHIDDWCLDRIARCFHETLEYLDVSGCTRLTDRGIGTLHRCRKLQTLKVEDMSHVKNLEIVCALLEDHNPELTVLGIDYHNKLNQMKSEADEIERKAKEEADKLEAQTATIDLDKEHRSGPFATPS